MKIDPEDYATVGHKKEKRRSSGTTLFFDPVNYGVILVKTKSPELKVEGSLLRNIGKVARAHTGYGLSEQEERRKAMADLFKDFQDWLSYNHPEIKLEPLQEDLVKIALRHWGNKVSKAARKAILKELAQQVMAKGK